MITREHLLKLRAEALAQGQAHVAAANQCSGRVALLDELLSLLQAPAAPADKPAQPAQIKDEAGDGKPKA